MWHVMFCHNPEVMDSNPIKLNVGVRSMFKSDFVFEFIEYQLNAQIELFTEYLEMGQMYFVTICITPNANEFQLCQSHRLLY